MHCVHSGWWPTKEHPTRSLRRPRAPDDGIHQPKLPGWTRRGPELTPRLNLRGTSGNTEGVDIEVFIDPANDVAYRMIGGAYGVLGAEVLGHFVLQALDADRWGIFIREAGIA